MFRFAQHDKSAWLCHSFVLRHSTFVLRHFAAAERPRSHMLDHVVSKLRASAFAKAPARCNRGYKLHMSNHITSKFAALDFSRAFHQPREIVGDAFARDRAAQ